jgi:hypothetical protein
MTTHKTYGASGYTVAELAGVLAERLGLTFVERECDYRGVYLVADAKTHRLEIQSNAIPGDDDRDDLHEAGHPNILTLVLISGPHPDGALTAGIESIDGLTRLVG